MSREPSSVQSSVARFLLKSRILALSFAASMVILIGVFVFLFQNDPIAETGKALPTVLGIFGALALVSAELLPVIIARTPGGDQLDVRLTQGFILVIIENALREAAAIVGAVVYVLAPEQRIISYVLWGLALVMMVLRFPTDKRLLRGIPPEQLR